MMGSRATPTVITDARSGTSKEMATRQKRYAITMAFRTACFIAMVFVSGNFRWVLLAGAVFLPYIAVVFANQANTRTPHSIEIPQAGPNDARQLTVGEPVETLSGEILPDEHDQRRDRAA